MYRPGRASVAHCRIITGHHMQDPHHRPMSSRLTMRGKPGDYLLGSRLGPLIRFMTRWWIRSLFMAVPRLETRNYLAHSSDYCREEILIFWASQPVCRSD